MRLFFLSNGHIALSSSTYSLHPQIKSETACLSGYFNLKVKYKFFSFSDLFFRERAFSCFLMVLLLFLCFCYLYCIFKKNLLHEMLEKIQLFVHYIIPFFRKNSLMIYWLLRSGWKMYETDNFNEKDVRTRILNCFLCVVFLLMDDCGMWIYFNFHLGQKIRCIMEFQKLTIESAVVWNELHSRDVKLFFKEITTIFYLESSDNFLQIFLIKICMSFLKKLFKHL